MRARREVPEFTRELQRQAADPALSAWVSANAGSGKTHVLAERVVRLLLSGAHPSKILCLTFTKAAAANMSQRVFKTLAAWTTIDESALAAAIETIGGARPNPAQRLLARQLFARAIETPGGLKIQTIHAFCEALLHRFPFEANVPARFDVLDEEGQSDLLRQARKEALALAAADARLGESLRALTAETSAASFDKVLDEALNARTAIMSSRSQEENGDDFAKRLRKALGIGPDQTTPLIERSMVEDGIAPSDWQGIAAILELGSASDRLQADRFRRSAAQAQPARLASYFEIFLTNAGEPRKRLVTVALEKRAPDLALRLEFERERIIALRETLRAAKTVERTQALLAIVSAILARYEALKSRRGRLDFDDLIERTALLLQRAEAAWVLYKLDAGVDHILVDEAQDTSEAQWRILQALVGEFTAGRGARDLDRTIFAVGDEKQSIYSFQGAAPHLFSSMRRFFAERHREADKAFEHIPLTMSFRSSPGVLGIVDDVFAFANHARGLSSEDDAKPHHKSWKTDLPGLLEIWEPLRPADRLDSRDWRLPLDAMTAKDPETILANRIAGQIEAWLSLDSRDVVHDDEGPRSIRRGDILILVRRRGALFESIIRALKERRVSVAGADRMALADHIAVMDLMAAGRTALLPEDDLTLACALKSPLIGLDDDDLLVFGPRRPGLLWSALLASPDERHREAARRIAAWRTRASQSPFDFYAHLLGAEGGRRDLIARLGPEASDAIDEFLALALEHGRDETPSLTNFLHRLETSSICVKRDMEAAADSVRVMTVHAAKGLEAKIVILPDTCGAASGRHDPVLYCLDSPHGLLPVYNPRRDSEPPRLAEARAVARSEQEAEHRRLLYVALTRAEERLYIAGVESMRGRGAGCWYDMIVSALAPRLVDVPANWDAQDRVRRLTHSWPPGRARAASPAADRAQLSTPAWLGRPADPERGRVPPLRPSSALAAADQSREDSADGDQNGARIGVLTHALLQRLPAVPAAARATAAARFLRMRGQGLSADVKHEIARRAQAVLADQRLAHLFGERARAEVAICGRVSLPGGGDVAVAGTIDRLAETADEIWIADFKTGAFQDGKNRRAHVAQLALYRALIAPLWPDRRVRACLVWTEGPHLIEPTANDFDIAIRSVRV